MVHSKDEVHFKDRPGYFDDLIVDVVVGLCVASFGATIYAHVAGNAELAGYTDKTFALLVGVVIGAFRTMYNVRKEE